jgi:hypothetical protein
MTITRTTITSLTLGRTTFSRMALSRTAVINLRCVPNGTQKPIRAFFKILICSTSNNNYPFKKAPSHKIKNFQEIKFACLKIGAMTFTIMTLSIMALSKGHSA